MRRKRVAPKSTRVLAPNEVMVLDAVPVVGNFCAARIFETTPNRPILRSLPHEPIEYEPMGTTEEPLHPSSVYVRGKRQFVTGYICRRCGVLYVPVKEQEGE